MQLFDLSGRVAVITGGNGGIGLGMAKGMAAAGATIVVAGRDAAKNTAAVSEIAVGGVDDRVHRLLEQIAPHDEEQGAGGDRLAMELVRRGGYSILALARRPFTSSSMRACTSCCWRRGLTSASAGNFTGRTSSSWIT